jgi:hypothetical protein
VVEFGITEELYNRRRSDSKGFYCPNGHSNVFKKPGEVEDEEEDDVTDGEEDDEEDDEKPQFEPIKIN